MTTSFGRDIACTTTLRTGRYATGFRVVAEAIYRRLTTPRGLLRGGEEEQNYGLDLMSLVGSVNTRGDAASLEGRIKTELSKDERIESVTASVLETTVGPAKSFAITINVVTAAGPFELQIGVDDVTVELLGIREDA